MARPGPRHPGHLPEHIRASSWQELTSNLPQPPHFLQVICYSEEKPVNMIITKTSRYMAFLTMGWVQGGRTAGGCLENTFSQTWASCKCHRRTDSTTEGVMAPYVFVSPPAPPPPALSLLKARQAPWEKGHHPSTRNRINTNKGLGRQSVDPHLCEDPCRGVVGTDVGSWLGEPGSGFTAPRSRGFQR